MTGPDTVTAKDAAAGRPTSGEVAGSSSVLAAGWCRSVGTSWTLELHRLRRGTLPLTLVDWISSGVPITQPQPTEALARELLTQRGLHLFPDATAGPATGSRRGIGYVTGDAELITLAYLVHNEATQTGLHPVMLAARWIAAGFTADTAARWIRQGAHCPQAAQQLQSAIGTHQVATLTLTIDHNTGSTGSPSTTPNDLGAALLK
jgi:uncharacterized protein YidB (DUF937 family)